MLLLSLLFASIISIGYVVHQDWPHNTLVSHVRLGDLHAVKKSIVNGADVNYCGKVLHTAVESGNLDIVELLVNHGAKLNENNGEALSVAVRKNNVYIFAYLVDKGAYMYYHNIIKNIIEYNNTDILNFMLSRGYNINANDGMLLYLATQAGMFEMVQFIVNNGADVKIRNNAALKASQYMYPNIAIYLIKNGATTDLNYHCHPDITNFIFTNNIYNEDKFGNMIFHKRISNM